MVLKFERSIGQDASSANMFCGAMNMPPSLKPNIIVMKAAKKVAEGTMHLNAEEIHQLSQDGSGINSCGVSCDCAFSNEWMLNLILMTHQFQATLGTSRARQPPAPEGRDCCCMS